MRFRRCQRRSVEAPLNVEPASKPDLGLERLRLVAAALDIQRQRTADKISSLFNRASFIVAADALLLGLRPATGTREAGSSWLVAAVMFSAVLAVVVLLGWRVREVAPEAIRKETQDKPIATVEWAIYKAKRSSLDSAVRNLAVREWGLRLATVLFLFGALTIAAQTAATPGDVSPSPKPVPTPTASALPDKLAS